MIYARERLVVGLLLIVSHIAWAVEPTTSPATTQPVRAGRNTPAGAANVYQQALERGDLITVADSWNQPPMPPADIARIMLINFRFCRAIETRFSKAEVANICKECRIIPVPRSIVYTDDNWEHPSAEPNIVYGKHVGDVDAGMMEKGDDGIWRFGRIFPHKPVPTPEMQARIAAMKIRRQGAQAAADKQAADFEQRLTSVTAEVAKGKYATVADVLHAVYPEGSPAERIRAAEEKRKAQDAADEAAPKQQLLAAHFDPSTVEGAAGAFLQAQEKRDPVGLARFFFAEGDKDNRLAKANAQRILAGYALENATRKIFGDYTGPYVSSHFQQEADAPEWYGPAEIHGDKATAPSEGEGGLLYRKVGGIWKVDISSPVPAEKRATEMEHDNAAGQKITADILGGKYKTALEVWAALEHANLYVHDANVP